MNEGNWRSTKDDLPGWEDSGPAELLYADGRIVSGDLTIIEASCEDGDAPVPEFTSDDGIDLLQLADAVAWRLKPAGSAAPPQP
jgi:hypothetical protein